MNRARLEIIAHAQSAFRRGLTPGCTGNLSVRVEDSLVMTPTGHSLGDLSPDSLSIVSVTGEHLSGPPPTKEMGLHLALYRADRGDAIVHLHSPYAVAYSCLSELRADAPIPFLTPYTVMRARDLRVVPYFRPGSPQLIRAVEDATTHAASLLLQRHGLLVAGADLRSAMDIAEEIEQAALVSLVLGDRGVPMTPAQIAEL